MGFEKKYNYNLKEISELESAPHLLKFADIGKKIGIGEAAIKMHLGRHTDKQVIRLPKGCKDELIFKQIRLLREQGNKEFEKEKRKKDKEFNENFSRDIFLGNKKNGK